MLAQTFTHVPDELLHGRSFRFLLDEQAVANYADATMFKLGRRMGIRSRSALVTAVFRKAMTIDMSSVDAGQLQVTRVTKVFCLLRGVFCFCLIYLVLLLVFCCLILSFCEKNQTHAETEKAISKVLNKGSTVLPAPIF